nr:hypothetical protein [Tanacetum cinerariifolium]GEW47271.1 hypothetical protein [Tanacetum cinerariifolium]
MHHLASCLLFILHASCMVSYKDDLYKLLLVQVMTTPAIPVSTEENLGDPIDIKMDIIHPEPAAAIAFPVAAVAENASLRSRIKTTKAIEKITHKRENRLVLRLSSSWLWFRSPNVRTERISGSSRNS